MDLDCPWVVYKIPYRRAPRLASASREQRYLAYKSMGLVFLVERRTFLILFFIKYLF